MTRVAHIGLGSNLGEPEKNLALAVAALAALPGVCVKALSEVYLTEPQGDPAQPWFANQVARLDCAFADPRRLLAGLLGIETSMGRSENPLIRRGPRLIDLDLLLFGALRRADKDLTLPHPRLRERAFVLVPLCDLDPDLPLPGGATPRALLRGLDYRREGRRIFQSCNADPGGGNARCC
jgi:2-amino-4-hydroxy-6-hydroxymethyldihydropteridine diphosphokinase